MSASASGHPGTHLLGSVWQIWKVNVSSCVLHSMYTSHPWSQLHRLRHVALPTKHTLQLHSVVLEHISAMHHEHLVDKKLINISYLVLHRLANFKYSSSSWSHPQTFPS